MSLQGSEQGVRFTLTLAESRNISGTREKSMWEPLAATLLLPQTLNVVLIVNRS